MFLVGTFLECSFWRFALAFLNPGVVAYTLHASGLARGQWVSIAGHTESQLYYIHYSPVSPPIALPSVSELPI